jgi:hypothetical protein
MMWHSGAHRCDGATTKRNDVTRFSFFAISSCRYTEYETMETTLTWLTDMAQIGSVYGGVVTQSHQFLQWSKFGYLSNVF